MNAAEMIALTRESDIEDTLTARKNIVEIKKFKKLMIFRIVFEESKKILKFNDFWVRDVVSTATLRRERSKMMIYEIRIKSMPQDIKNDGTKVVKKADEVMHSKLQIESVKWLAKDCDKKKYASMIAWMRDAEIANRLIQLKLIMKSNIKIIKYYERDCRVKQCTKCQKYDHWTYVCKNKQCCAHYAQKHRFAKCSHQKKMSKWRCGLCKRTHRTFNFQYFKRQTKKERIRVATKTKFMYHAIRTKEISITMIFSFVSTLKDIVIWTEKNTKRKTNRSSKERRFNEFATFCQERKNNMNQFAKRKRSENSLKSETLMRNQNNFCVSTTSNEYDSKVNIMCS